MARKAVSAHKPWYANPQTVISSIVGFLTVSGGIVGYFVAQANDRRDIKDVQEEVAKLASENDAQEQAIDQTEIQYQLINQQLGVVVDALKEMKGKR